MPGINNIGLVRCPVIHSRRLGITAMVIGNEFSDHNLIQVAYASRILVLTTSRNSIKS